VEREAGVLEIILWILAAIAGLILLDRLFLWMKARGWVYYRKIKSKSSAGDILTGMGFADPGMRHLEEARREHVLEEEDDGDDDGHRKPEDRLT
jgi:hypothetical protein